MDDWKERDKISEEQGEEGVDEVVCGKRDVVFRHGVRHEFPFPLFR